jgi:hypothetical protein
MGKFFAMSEKTDYFLQVLKAIGTPLMVPVLIHGDGKDEDAAKEVAGLLAKTVQASIDLGPLVDIDTLGERTDSVRVALAGLAAQMTGASYDRLGRMPADSDVKKMHDGLQAAISFSDNFTASPESVMRLETVAPNGAEVDTPQSVVQYLGCFVPVLKAVSTFSFGQPEAKLIGDIAARLTEKARDIGTLQLSTAYQDDALRSIERGILHCLAQIYAASHEAEVKRLNQADRDNAAKGGLDSVWKAFDTQVKMLEILVQMIVPGGVPVDIDETDSTQGSESTDTKVPAKVAEKPAQEVPPVASKPQADSPSMSGSGPMSFFKPKSDDEDEGAEAPDPEPAKEAPVQQPPKAAQPEQKKTAPPTGQTGSPMSFFKPKSDDGDEE